MLNKSQDGTRLPSGVGWCPPNDGQVKVNVDAAIKDHMPFIGVGVFLEQRQFGLKFEDRVREPGLEASIIEDVIEVMSQAI
ncbi:hypothetical protein L484_007604 [Morus notabilis]|uniref:Uncharacterized protein n=1 Tax=Morus notabilis TaxID=981085 RepID=W9RS96_9ROSA|nr:hypothetical protein L484_007604 [Morus notabilis]